MFSILFAEHSLCAVRINPRSEDFAEWILVAFAVLFVGGPAEVSCVAGALQVSQGIEMHLFCVRHENQFLKRYPIFLHIKS